jgi:NADH-quinone oxidoreductase subunit J
MMLEQIAFVFLSALSLGSAVLVITRRNPVHSIIALIVTLLSVGGVFLLLRAEFLFAVQIILYVGGIMVLFLFVVMLINIEVVVTEARFNRQWALALGTAAVLGTLLVYGLWQGREGFALGPATAPAEELGNTQAVARALYLNYMLPVEIASLLLLVAMIGAVILAKRRIG